MLTSQISQHVLGLVSGRPFGAYNVRDYGAKGDGVTDDRAAIQAALDAAAGTGGLVYIPAGTYLLSDTIQVPGNTVLCGAGPSTVLTIPNNASITPIQTTLRGGGAAGLVAAVVANKQGAGTTEGITITNLRIEGNGDNQTAKNMTGVLLHGAKNCQIIDVDSRNFIWLGYVTNTDTRQFCVLLTNCDQVTVRGGHYTRAGYEPIGIRDGCTRIAVLGAVASQGHEHVIQTAGTGTSQVVIDGCLFSQRDYPTNGQGQGFCVHSCSSISVTHCIFDLCNIHTVADPGNSSYDIRFADNIINLKTGDTFGWNGIACRAVKNIVITGNVIRGDAVPGISGTGTAEGTFQDAVIAHNAIFTNHRGIAIDGVAGVAQNGIVISNNRITSVYPAIRIAGKTLGPIIIGNVVSGSNYGVYLTGEADGALIEGNDVSAASVGVAWTIGTHRVKRNRGWATENSGTATVSSGATSVVVSHGLALTPTLDDITVVPTNNLGNAAKFWVSDATATTFTINVNADPGAATATFAWRAEVS